MSTRATSSPVRIQLLGAPAIDTAMGPLSPAKSFVFAAALYLGLNRGRRIRREELATLLWPDASDAKRGERTRWLVRQLRLAGLPIGANTPEVGLTAADVTLDVGELAAAPSAVAALALAPAAVLAGYTPRISDRYELWLEERKDAIRFEVLGILAGWLDTTRRGQAWSTLAEIARRMLALDESRADAAAALTESVAQQGRSPAARQTANVAIGPFVGRGDLVAQLSAALAPSCGPGHRVSIAGPPGIGKTRILEQLAHVGAAHRLQVAQLRCQRGDAMQPLSLGMELARTVLDMRGALGASPESIQALRCFVGDQQWPREDEDREARRAAVFAALRDVVGAVAEESGLVVAIDDAQWADRGSLSLLAPTFGQRSPSPLCWAVTIRAETREQAAEIHDLIFPSDDAASERQRELVWLKPLDAASVAQVTAARAMPRVIPAAVFEALAERAAGIPFVAEALVDHWLEVGDLASLPPSVLRLVQSRLDRLEPNAEHLLRVIAVLELEASPAAAEAVTQLDRRELLGAIERLETSGIVRLECGSFRAHALWTEAALAGTPKATRQILHRYAAQWLERRELAEPRHHWAVAKHWVAADDHAEARRALGHAADVLVANGFVAEAAEMLRQAGNSAGCSPVALNFWERSARLWAWIDDAGQRAADAVLDIHRRYDEVAQALDPEGFTPHHDVEAYCSGAVIRRSAYQHLDERSNPLQACVMAERASHYHRTRALGRLLHRAVRSALDRDAAIAMWEAISKFVPADEDEAREYEFCAAQFYLHVAENFDAVRVHADRAVTIVMQTQQPWSGDSDFVISAIADSYELLGDLDRTFRIHFGFLAESRRRKRSQRRYVALNALIGTLLEAGRHQDARVLLPEIGQPRLRDLEQDSYDRGRAIYWTVCELEAGDSAAARAVIPSLATADHVVGMGRARVLAMHVHLALLEGDDAMMKSLLAPLIDCFSGRHTYMDHPALMAAICLERFDGWDAAAEFVRRYVTEIRLERWTPRAELQRYLEPSESGAAMMRQPSDVGSSRAAAMQRTAAGGCAS